MRTIKNASEVRRLLKSEIAAEKNIKIALLGDSSTQWLSQAIIAVGLESFVKIELFEGEYDQIENLIFDANSDLYQFKPQIVLLFFSHLKIKSKFYKSEKAARADFMTDSIAKLKNLVVQINHNTNCSIITNNYVEKFDAVFGNFSLKNSSSLGYQIKLFNCQLMNMAIEINNLFVADLNGLVSQWGCQNAHSERYYITSDLLFDINFYPKIAYLYFDIIQAINGNIKKCIIVDLDNTLWGGVIGDDGLEKIQLGNLGEGKIFVEFQCWLKEMKERGVILCVCSKNDEAVAKIPFLRHPDSVLKLEDFAVFMANWENKAQNIQQIQTILNIGFDAMVFIDDSPFERNLVRQFIPQICVPELPNQPEKYLTFLESLNLFETVSFISSDSNRTQQYQEEANRHIFQKNFVNEKDYLASLDMRCLVQGFTKFNVPRVAQLTQRSNQFNLTTKRYTERDIEAFAALENFGGLCFSLRDKFGDYGLVAVIIFEVKGESLIIDTWVQSCRVLKRGLEAFSLAQIIKIAESKRCNTVLGNYVPTAKNGMVAKHYPDLGFKPSDNTNRSFSLKICDHATTTTYILFEENQK